MTEIRKLIESLARHPFDSDWHLAQMVAKRTKISRWSIYNWLLGRSAPSQHTIIYLRGILASE